MNKIKSVKFNFIMNIILTMSTIIFPIITFPYVSRILGPEGTGKVSFITSIVSYFAMFAQLGIPIYAIRECANVRDDKEKLSKTVQEIMIINIIMTIIVYCALIITVVLVSRLRNDKVLVSIISLTIIFNSIGVEWVYKGLEQYSYITMRSIIFKLIAVILMFLLVRNSNDYIIYGATTIVASCGSNIFNLIHLRKIVYIEKKSNYNLKRHLKPIMIFFAMSIATTVYTNLDTVMLGFMKSDIEVGYYTSAVKIKMLLVSLITSLGAVLLPRVSYYVKNSKVEEYKKITNKAVNFVLLLSFPLTLFCILYAKEIIFFLAGSEYIGSIIPMQIIMPTLIFIGLSNLFAYQILVPRQKEKVVLKAEIFGACSNLLLNIVLIPKYASSGAAIGTLVAEAIVLIILFMSDKEIIINAFSIRNTIKIIISSFVALIIAAFIKKISMHILIKLFLASGCYFGLYGIILLLIKEKTIYQILEQLKIKLLNLFLCNQEVRTRE